MRRKRLRWLWALGWTWHLGRARLDVVPSNFNRPLFSYANHGPGFHFVSMGWGNGNSDAAISVELNLGGK